MEVAMVNVTQLARDLVESRDRGIMRLCARIISRIIGDLPHIIGQIPHNPTSSA